MKNLAYRCLASGLALLLAVNTPVFGRWAHSCWSPAPMAACQPIDCSMPACGPTDWNPCGDPCGNPCGVVESSGGCGPFGVPMAMPVVESSASDCGCSGSVTSSIIHSSPTVHGSSVTHEHHAHQQPTLASPPQPTEVDEPAPSDAFGGGFRSDQPAADQADVVEDQRPSDAWDAGFNSAPASDEPEVSEPAELQAGADMPLFNEPAAEEPADDLFGDTPVEEPAEEMPADDLFGAPADEPVAESVEPPADDLFGAEPAEAPAEEMPADDLFGDAPEAPAPEEMPADDLFGEEPATQPADAGNDLFGEPAEEPADTPADAGDDLFGGADTFEPAEEGPADDLFGEPAEPAPEEPAAEAPADDLFGEEAPAEEPADAADDLFGGEEDDAADDLFGGEEEPAEESAEDDLFGDFGAILSEPGGAESVRDRTWIDNTGRHSTVGRLIAIDGGSVRLEKNNGTVATVPLGRLSQADLEFVSRQAIAMTEAREWAIANGKPTDKNAPKQARSTDKMPLRTAQL